MKTCKQCQTKFKVTDKDREFYKKVNVSDPTLCPLCRRIRRAAHHNERTLYMSDCDLCSKKMVAMYAPDVPFPVYCKDCWWSDKWDETSFAQEPDFNRSFFEQWHELMLKTPKLHLLNTKSENSEFTHFVSNNKDCYLIFMSDYNRSCYYSNWLLNCEDTVDCLRQEKTQKSYECFFGEKLYNCQYCINCFNSIDSIYCYDCRDVQNCAFSYNLRNKKHMIFNKQYTPEEYKKKIDEMNLGTVQGRKEAQEKFTGLIKDKAIRKYRNQFGTVEKSTGDYLSNSKNCHNCFDIFKVENARHCNNVFTIKDVVDCENVAESELGYEMIECVPMPQNSIGCFESYSGFDQNYTHSCMNSNNMLLTSSMKKREYCILNKQYSKEEYEALKKKIIEKMAKDKEWGEFLSPKYSLWGYKETLAQIIKPRTKEEAVKQGYKWQDTMPNTTGKETMSVTVLPNVSKQIDVSKLSNQILACGSCKKNYKLIKQELEFYKANGIPVPHNCPDCRHSARLKLHNPNVLNHSQCKCTLEGHSNHSDGERCSNEFETTYSVDGSEKMFCEWCYQKEVA